MTSPRISSIKWGAITIDSRSTQKDYKLWPGGGRAWDWGETGTRHKPGIQPADIQELLDNGAEVIVLSRGMQLVLCVPEETKEWVEQQDGVRMVYVAETKEAVEVYNRLASEGAKCVEAAAPGHLPVMDPTRQIRLLRIFPGPVDSRVESELFVADLDQKPPYRCISYVWGSAKTTETIHISGTPVRVLPNLLAALSHIRSMNQEFVVIWVDSVCINQNDDEEKSQQVKMMKQIYQSCYECYIWLGEIEPIEIRSSGLSDEALAAMTHNFIEFMADDANQDRELNENLLQPGVLTDIGYMTDAMVSSSWWTRVWTLQECVVSPKAFVIWGQLAIDWHSVLNASRSLVHITRFQAGSQIQSAIGELGNGHLFTGRIVPLLNLRAGYRESPMDLLWRYSERKASNPLDMVYAILPLMEDDVLPNVRIDYALDPSTLYQTVMRDLILHYDSLKPLVGRTHRTFQNRTTPSWVMDWTRARTEMEWWTANYMFEQFDACYGLPPLDEKEVSVQGSQLLLRGFQLDLVKIHAPPEVEADAIDSKSPTRPVKASQPNWRVKANMARWHRSIKSDTFDQLIDKGFTRPEAADRIDELTQAIDRAVAGRMISEYIEDPGIVGKTMRDAWTQDIQPERTLYVTESGDFGFGPQNLQSGDEIWVLCGGRVPFLLRPTHEAAPGQANNYEMVGDVYLEGNMWGQSVPANMERLRQVVIV